MRKFLTILALLTGSIALLTAAKSRQSRRQRNRISRPAAEEVAAARSTDPEEPAS
jgi:hypothetical protein